MIIHVVFITASIIVGWYVKKFMPTMKKRPRKK